MPITTQWEGRKLYKKVMRRYHVNTSVNALAVKVARYTSSFLLILYDPGSNEVAVVQTLKGTWRLVPLPLPSFGFVKRRACGRECQGKDWMKEESG